MTSPALAAGPTAQSVLGEHRESWDNVPRVHHLKETLIRISISAALSVFLVIGHLVILLVESDLPWGHLWSTGRLVFHVIEWLVILLIEPGLPWSLFSFGWPLLLLYTL